MISVIVPTWNEEEHLGTALSAIQNGRAPREVFVVDAGSTDQTVEVARGCGATVLVSPVRQRAAQLNLGAANSTGEIILFLHADTIVPPGALDLVQSALEHFNQFCSLSGRAAARPYLAKLGHPARRAARPRGFSGCTISENGLADESIVGGAFERRFQSASWFLRSTCALAAIRNRAIGWHLGDQAMFARRSAFETLGGFAPMDRFEDLEFSRRLGRMGRLVTLRPPVMTSARRFERNGPFVRTARDFALTMQYLRRNFSKTTNGRE